MFSFKYPTHTCPVGCGKNIPKNKYIYKSLANTNFYLTAIFIAGICLSECLANRNRAARSARRAHNPEVGGSNPLPAIFLF